MKIFALATLLTITAIQAEAKDITCLQNTQNNGFVLKLFSTDRRETYMPPYAVELVQMNGKNPQRLRLASDLRCAFSKDDPIITKCEGDATLTINLVQSSSLGLLTVLDYNEKQKHPAEKTAYYSLSLFSEEITKLAMRGLIHSDLVDLSRAPGFVPVRAVFAHTPLMTEHRCTLSE